MNSHRGESGDPTLEEVVLETLDQAAGKVTTFKRIVVAGVVFILAFSGTTVYALAKIGQIADENQQYLVDGCVSGNESRANELSFWLSLFETTKNDPDQKTPTALQRRKEYMAKLYKTYPQVDCTKVKVGKRVVIQPKQN